MQDSEWDDDKLYISAQDPAHSPSQGLHPDSVPGTAWTSQISKANENAFYPLLMCARLLLAQRWAGAGVCRPWHGSRHVGWQAGFELAAYYFWHGSCHLLNEKRKLLLKVLKV